MKRWFITIHTAPTPDCEAIEFALAMAAFDQEVCLFFCQDGVWWLATEQATRRDGGKNPEKLINALAMYGITDIGVPFDAELPSNIAVNISYFSNEDVAQRMTQAHVVSF
ncbi:MAG: DsrE family protein [Oleibacter sp.]|nr:DsrE family protein [Thalassolituus sp.]